MYPLVTKKAIQNGHLELIYPLKMMIFHNYVALVYQRAYNINVYIYIYIYSVHRWNKSSKHPGYVWANQMSYGLYQLLQNR